MSGEPLGLGLDAGGTQTRWALANAGGEIISEGFAAGLSGLQLSSATGRDQLRAALNEIGKAVLAAGAPARVVAGITGLDEERDLLGELIATPLGLPAQAVTLKSDIELVCLELFAPGEGIVVYAGTGTIAAHLDVDSSLQRAGGRGALLDDAGGGYWIAHEALQGIWRREDSRPGSWRTSTMAQKMFEEIGGHDWSHSRKFIYQRARGDIGRLALAVAASAEADPVARALLMQAGHELARLADAMLQRLGPLPIALTGRAWSLHPLIETSFREVIGIRAPIALRSSKAHLAAARLAAGAANAVATQAVTLPQ